MSNIARTFTFALVDESGEEWAIPIEDIAEAMRLAKEQKGLEVRSYLEGANDPSEEHLSPRKKVTIEASGIMAIIHQLSNMPQYRGRRIDAIEVGSSH